MKHTPTSPEKQPNLLRRFSNNFLGTSAMGQDWLVHRRLPEEQQMWKKVSEDFYHLEFSPQLSASIRHLPDRGQQLTWRLQIHMQEGAITRWFPSYNDARCNSWRALFVAQEVLAELGNPQAAYAAAIYWLHNLGSLFK